MLQYADTYSTFSDDLTTISLVGNCFNSHPCGYITPSGTMFKCQPYEHMQLLERVITSGRDNYFAELYKEFKDYVFENHIHINFDHSLLDMFVLNELHWVKIAAYGKPGSSGPRENWRYDFYLIRCAEMTPKQTEIVYPI